MVVLGGALARSGEKCSSSEASGAKSTTKMYVRGVVVSHGLDGCQAGKIEEPYCRRS
jgi:hypothetical protein